MKKFIIIPVVLQQTKAYYLMLRVKAKSALISGIQRICMPIYLLNDGCI